jgi:hypothetical protein
MLTKVLTIFNTDIEENIFVFHVHNFQYMMVSKFVKFGTFMNDLLLEFQTDIRN